MCEKHILSNNYLYNYCYKKLMPHKKKEKASKLILHINLVIKTNCTQY